MRIVNKKRIGIKKRNSKIGNVIYNHIVNNKKNYIIVLLLFIIGLIIGTMYINNMKEDKIIEIDTQIKELVSNIKSIEKIDYITLLKESITSNLILIVIIWIASSTIIGIPIVYITVIFRGFTLGYTISSILAILGPGKGILFVLSTLLVHNIIFIPGLLATSVSGMKLYKSITKNKEKDNIKLEFIRHTIFCLIMLVLLIVGSFSEVYISTNISKICANYINF